MREIKFRGKKVSKETKVDYKFCDWCGGNLVYDAEGYLCKSCNQTSNIDPLHEFVQLCRMNCLAHTVNTGGLLTVVGEDEENEYHPNLPFGSPEALEWLKKRIEENK